MNATSPIVNIDQASKQFGTVQALNQVSLAIEEGTFFGLLGSNGAGKTTLIAAMCGLTTLDSGTITINGVSVQEDGPKSRMFLGVVPQELVFDPFFTTRETLRLQSGYFGLHHNDDWIDEILVNLDLHDKADINMRRLSGGMKRRVLIAQALVHKPPVIVLDEPTAGVDVELRQNLWQFISRLNKEGHTIILTTHYLEEAEALCDSVAMMQYGQIVTQERTSLLIERFGAYAINMTIKGGTVPEALQKIGENDGNRWRFSFKQHSEINQILYALYAAECQVSDLSIEETDLEDVFINIMGKQRK